MNYGGVLMFFSEKELKIAEDLAWKMLDGWNHAYCPNLNDYAYFYYKGKVILDPWMNEKAQELPWPDHESKDSAVVPVRYYGKMAIESFVARLFMLCPEWAPEITEKIKANSDECGRIIYHTTTMPVEVYIAMSDQQAEEEHGYRCIENAIPDSYRIYLAMDELPEDIFHVIKMGWEREVIFQKKNIKKAMSCLFPDGANWNYKKYVDRIMGNEIRLIGFGD